MPEVITQDELIQRIEELEAFVSRVANWTFDGDRELFEYTDYLLSQVEEAQDEALALLEP